MCLFVNYLSVYRFLFFKQKTAYEMRIRDWGSDVCSSDLRKRVGSHPRSRSLLARQREESAASAHLRHRVADERRAARLPAPPRGGRQARPPQAGRKSGVWGRRVSVRVDLGGCSASAKKNKNISEK